MSCQYIATFDLSNGDASKFEQFTYFLDAKTLLSAGRAAVEYGVRSWGFGGFDLVSLATCLEYEKTLGGLDLVDLMDGLDSEIPF